MKRCVLVVFFLWNLLALFLPQGTFAQSCPPDQALTDFGCIPKDPVQFASRFYKIGLGFVGGAAVLAIIYGGYIILTSQGDHEQLSKGKSYIYYAIAGALLALFGIVFIEVIAVDILCIPGLSRGGRPC